MHTLSAWVTRTSGQTKSAYLRALDKHAERILRRVPDDGRAHMITVVNRGRWKRVRYYVDGKRIRRWL